MDGHIQSPGSREEPPRDAASPIELTLIKGRHAWRFRCAPGDEGVLLDALAELARRRGTGVDRFDATLLAHQLKALLAGGLASSAFFTPSGGSRDGDSGSSLPPTAAQQISITTRTARPEQSTTPLPRPHP